MGAPRKSFNTETNPGPLIALLLVAQGLENWCPSLAAQVRSLAIVIEHTTLVIQTIVSGDKCLSKDWKTILVTHIVDHLLLRTS